MSTRRALMCLLVAAVVVVGLEYFSRPPGPSPQSQAWQAKMALQVRLKLIGLAIHGYSDEHGHLPNTICDHNGKPLLSWRVAVLPFMDEAELFKQFKLDEPWDSDHNKRLIEKMPDVFRHRPTPTTYGQTHFRGFNGPGTFFETGKRLRVQSSFFFYGDKIVTVVEAQEPAVWTEPNDLPFDPAKPLPPLGGVFPGGFHAATVFGHVEWVNEAKYDPDLFKTMVDRTNPTIRDVDRAFGK
jgi:hypothetical protein